MEEKITPFNNGAEFWLWTDKNCDCCAKYENQSSNIEGSDCPLLSSIKLAIVRDGKITLDIAKRIGLDQNGNLLNKCREFELYRH